MKHRPQNTTLACFQCEDAPQITRRLGHGVPAQAMAIGNLDILTQPLTAFFCSRKCPGDLILRAYDWAREARDKGTAVVSGFHSPIEKDCLGILLRGRQPVIICPARGLESMRIPREWRQPIADRRLLILSVSGVSVKRPTAGSCEERNRFAAQLADDIVFAYADSGGKADELRRWALELGGRTRSKW